MADTTSFDSMFQAVQELPPTWGPRREQPEWDRDFGGNADIKWHFGNRTDTAHMWLAFCLNFSAAVQDGFETKENLMAFAKDMRGHIAKGKKQFDS